MKIQKAMKKMNYGKSGGNDGILFEHLEALGSFGVETLTQIVNRVHVGNIPEEMIESIFVTLPKKEGTIECKDHRTISLMSHVTKIILRVVLNRLTYKIRQNLSDEQFGYKPGKGTQNAIFCLRSLAEKCIEKQKDLYICFIDYVKAFDCVNHSKLIKMLESLGIDGKDLRLVTNLYWDQKAAVRLHGKTGVWVEIQKGVHQGSVLSPDLFNLYSETSLLKLKGILGVKIGNKNYNNLRYADDTALIADSREKLQDLLNIATKESLELVCSKRPQIPRCHPSVNGTVIAQKECFTYLGSRITSDARSETDIKSRISIAKKHLWT